MSKEELKGDKASVYFNDPLLCPNLLSTPCKSYSQILGSKKVSPGQLWAVWAVPQTPPSQCIQCNTVQ